jgi:penicillin-binding protein 2
MSGTRRDSDITLKTQRFLYLTFTLFLAACGLFGSATPTGEANTATPEVTLPPPGGGVTPPPNSEGTASAFMNAWTEKNYAGMYSLLSPLSRDAISQEDFEARYKAAEQEMTLSEIQTSILAALPQGEVDAQVQFRVTYKTRLVGDLSRDITIPLHNENGRWTVSWDDGLILPELKGGNTLYMAYTIPSRANIYDRNGLAFAAQQDAVALGLIPGQITDEGRMLRVLSQLLDRHPDVIKGLYANAQSDWYINLGEISAEKYLENENTLLSLGGLVINTYKTRFYLNGSLGAPHAVGYVSLITKEELNYYRALGYSGSEWVGRTGLELWGEQYLAGKRGGTLVVLTPGGQVSATLAESESEPGKAIYSTLDREFQKQVVQAMGDLPGAAVVMNIHTGEILAMVSSPSFDPNSFDPTNFNSSAAIQQLQGNPYSPLLNRVTNGVYPPGSTFKVINVSAGLKSGLFTRDTQYTCTGYWSELGANFVKHDWTVDHDLPPHGEIILPQALTYSCNPYNYHIGFELFNVDPEYLPKVAREFGLGAPTGIVGLSPDNNEESGGLVPDIKWKESNIGEKWTAGDQVNMAIGQGFLQVTPLQMAVVYAALGNGGTLYRPQLVQSVAAPGEDPVYAFKPEVIGQIPITAEQLDVIREGLRGVVEDRNGTARAAMVGLQVKVYGKTGTAEDSPRKPHAWFIGYTDAERDDKPDIVVAVVLSNRGEGADWAAPIFRRIVENYFFGRSYRLYPWESDFGLTATPEPTIDPNAPPTTTP